MKNAEIDITPISNLEPERGSNSSLSVSNHSSDSLPQVLHDMAALKAPGLNLVSPLHQSAKQLSDQFSLPHEISLLLCLSPIAAVTGPSRSIQNPWELALPSTLHLIFTGDNLFSTRAAINHLFSDLLSEVRTQVKEQAAITPYKRNTALASAFLKFEEAKAAERKVYEKIRRRDSGEQLYLTEAIALNSGTPLETRLKNAAEEVQQHRSSVGELHQQFRPAYIAEALPPQEFDNLKKLSFDGGVMNFDPEGTAIDLLLTTTQTLRRNAARALAAAFDGRTTVKRGNAIPSPWLSSISAPDSQLVWRLFSHPELHAQNLPRCMLLVDMGKEEPQRSSPPPKSSQGEIPMAGVLAELMRRRREGEDVLHHITHEAVDVFTAFGAEVANIPAAGALRDYISAWPSLALKIALHLHLGGGKHRQIEIGAEVMEEACDLVRLFGARMVLSLSSQQLLDRKQMELEAEIELMVTKVRMKGPISRRELSRTYANQKTAFIEPVLLRAIERGSVREEQGRLIAAS